MSQNEVATTRTPPPEREVPEGFRLIAVPDEDWRLVDGKTCRMRSPRVSCVRPAVAEFNRGRHTTQHGRVASWWAYCPAHMYGRWVENGQVLHWILVADE